MQRMMDPEEALELVLAHVEPRGVVETSLAAAHGLVLAETVRADRDLPPFNRAMMDGYAVRAADAGDTVSLTGEVAAGQVSAVTVEPGACVAIMTGAACPGGTEAVVKLEDTHRDGDRVTLPPKIVPGKHMAPRGCECEAGQVVLEPGARVTPLVAAVLASVGKEEVAVHRAPGVTVITTGSELVAAGAAAGDSQIHDSNGPMLGAQVRRTGICEPPVMLHAADTPESLAVTLEQAAGADVVLLSGGVSMGRYDLGPGALEDHGVTLVLYKVTQKPGKPLLFGHRGQQLFFGLPGNPLSSHFCFFRYVAPTLERLAGLQVRRGYRRGRLTAPLRSSSARTTFLLAMARDHEGQLQVTPLPGKGSADIFSAPTANAYLRLPPGEQDLAPGDTVDIQWMGERR